MLDTSITRQSLISHRELEGSPTRHELVDIPGFIRWCERQCSERVPTLGVKGSGSSRFQGLGYRVQG